MALSFNSATKKWERSPTTAPVTSSIPTAPAPVKTPTPVTATQQTDPAKAKLSSIGTTSGTMPTPTPKPTPAVAQPINTQPITTPEQNEASKQQAYSFIGAPKQPTTPTQPTGTTQPTTPAEGTPTPEAPAQDEWIGQSKSEEQSLQDNINKTQEELMNLRNREDALGQAEYLKKTKELQEYQIKQKEITDKQKAMSEEQAQIQSSVKLREAQKSLSQLKRNTAYLSSQGLGQSAGALDAFSEQISNAEQTFKEMKQYEQYAEDMRKLGVEFDANAYEQSMKEQQDELNKYVSDTIQTIFNNMSAAEMAGQMDTVDEVDAFAQKYFNSIDTDIANITRKQIQIADQKLVLQTQQLERAREFVKNKAVVNKDMSIAQGYYVDGNGQPLISATGGVIPIPAESPMEPIFNEKTGQLVSFTTGPDGQIVADVQQIIDMPTFGASTISNMAKAVANGTMTVAQALDVLPPASQQAFMDQIGDIKPAGQDKEIKTIELSDGTKQSVVFDPATGDYSPVQPSGFTPNGTPINQAIKTAIEKNKTGAQCGRFVNDILQNMGLPRLVKDSYQSKEMAISQIGIATSYNDMGAGSIFAYPVKGSNYGHIGIVTGVNDDGTIDIMDYNYKGDQQRRERQNVDPAEIINMGGRISKPIIREDTVADTPEEIGIDNIISFNDDVTRRKMSKEEVKRIGEAKKAVMSNPNADINQIMQYSAGGKAIGETASKSLIKFEQALAQLDAVQSQIKDMKTGPIIGKFRNMNPWDTNAQVLKATIQGLIPTIARGVYGEVGVLTDNDVRLYAQTLPNLKGTDAINKGVLAVTLDVLAGGYKKQITGLAGQGYDVSGLEGTYANLKGQAESLKREIGVGTQQTAPAKTTTPKTTVKDPLGILDL